MNMPMTESSYRMPLNQLLADMVDPTPPALMVSGLKLDSRQVVAGDLFFALQGSRDSGLKYIDKAAARGAVAILVESEALTSLPQCEAPLIGVDNLKNKVSDIAGHFYRHPSQLMEVVGVTGTNGKTSCCQFVASAMDHLGIRCGVIGTLGFGAVDNLQATTHTTPDAIMMQQMLADLSQEGFKAVALEVSSHGMDQSRVDGVRFDTAVFTNLTRDHLDYHGDMQSYAESKRRFFDLPGIRHAIINVDDPYGREMVNRLPERLAVYRYSISDNEADVRVTKAEFSSRGLKAAISSPWGDGIIKSALLGRFNLANLLAVFSVLCVQGIPIARALEAIASLTTVSGRMERFGGAGLPTVVVDYAHTPNALEVTLGTLRELCAGKLWCVFGCGGDRDQGKRAEMGQIAENMSDELVLTNDNPRGEKAESIIQDIKSGMRNPDKARVELDRAAAIRSAIQLADERDMILVAGKGHESWQEIEGARIAFSDVEQVKQSLNMLRSGSGG